MPLISIITVVYNSVSTLPKTIESIISQDYNNIEYIVVDGGSNDGTLELIKQYSNHISYWISEPDNGLYDAMNKGIQAATGDYLWFINAGDQIYNPHTLTNLFSKFPASDVYYGETLVINKTGNQLGMRRLKIPKILSWKSFKMGMLVSHQSIIIKKKIAPLYNLNYRYAADFNWVIESLKKATSIVNTALILSKFLDGGRTKQTIIPGLKERFKIMCLHYGCISTILIHSVIGFKFIWFILINRRF